MKMKFSDVVTKSANIINSNIEINGPTEEVYERAAKIASVMLGVEVSAYEVSIIVSAVGLGSVTRNRSNSNNYAQAIASMSFASQLAEQPEQAMLDEVESSIKDMAAKLAPMPRAEPIDLNKDQQ
jgi:hypothetical protein